MATKWEQANKRARKDISLKPMKFTKLYISMEKKLLLLLFRLVFNRMLSLSHAHKMRINANNIQLTCVCCSFYFTAPSCKRLFFGCIVLFSVLLFFIDFIKIKMQMFNWVNKAYKFSTGNYTAWCTFCLVHVDWECEFAFNRNEGTADARGRDKKTSGRVKPERKGGRGRERRRVKKLKTDWER